MYLNNKLFTFFDGMESFAYNNATNPTQLLVFRDLKNNYYYPPQYQLAAPSTAPPQVPISFTDLGGVTYTARPEWFIFTQQYDIIEAWNALSSVVFFTSHLPVQVEYIPSSSIITPQGVSNAAFKPILTDFVPLLEKTGSTRSRFVYYPSGQFRLVDLRSQIPLRKIDLQIFWQDQYQNLYPMYISFNESNTVKLMFIRKSLINHNYGYT